MPAGESNYGGAGPTIESLPSEPGHSQDTSRPSRLARFAKWLQSPMNLVLFLWLIPVVVGLVLMVLLTAGAVVEGSERRKKWIEAVNQILNAFFTVGCLFTHPEVFYHLLHVVRWRPEDQEKVRGVYCSGKTPEPRDRKHLLVVVSLINLTWVGQYVMCALYWAYNRHNRPGAMLGFWVLVTLLAPVAASIYTVKGPLKSNKSTTDQEDPIEPQAAEECRLRFCSGGAVVASPEWDGGPFDCCDDTNVCLPSFFCTFCVFGRNMNRLGFGSRNMHAVTFLIAVVSPFAVFLITAAKVDGDGLKIVLAVTGAVLSWVGFLYGGYWRIKMRERFHLPGTEFLCFGRPFLADYFQWLFCGPCSLAQEVRTAYNYDIEEGHGSNEMVSLPREGNASHLESNGSFSDVGLKGHYASEPGFSSASSTYSKVHAMAPPHRPSM
ncbi:uncharacterized protein M6B38_159490 [Iris pallida]|uniref:Uncharacterized protein n=1 Tax=Iris pallida TaxID=29817 RepID=A0AAX6EMU6_IRIPA|nr:uncharacterized protein M6B38_180755 [Iris pallida]KAJ6805493.1 uncharacterized protein M6B38_180760 [Iris pallida]KAJ6809932.1 uncharacterized protein M6B38_159490 [Iris pallida]